MSKDHPFVCRHEIAAIIEAFRRSRTFRVEDEYFGRHKTAVKAISQRITANRRHNQPHGVDLLTAMQSNGRNRHRAGEGKQRPDKNVKSLSKFLDRNVSVRFDESAATLH